MVSEQGWGTSFRAGGPETLLLSCGHDRTITTMNFSSNKTCTSSTLHHRWVKTSQDSTNSWVSNGFWGRKCQGFFFQRSSSDRFSMPECQCYIHVHGQNYLVSVGIYLNNNYWWKHDFVRRIWGHSSYWRRDIGTHMIKIHWNYVWILKKLKN